MILRSIALGVAAIALLSSAANAADLIIPTTPEPIYDAAGFSWDGLYAGVRAGGGSFNSVGFGAVGGVVGFNFLPVEPFLIGAEVSADYLWDATGSAGEYFFNLKAGAVVTDSVLIYALGGVGNYSRAAVNQSEYQLGGGIEVAVTDSVSARAEVVGQGDFDGAADAFFEGAKVTVGAFYHF